MSMSAAISSFTSRCVARRHSLALAVVAWAALCPTASRAETTKTDGAVQTTLCAPLVKELRWHEPFFGMRMWKDVSDEALASAPLACREQIAAGKAKEVSVALRELVKHDEKKPQLQRFSTRIACQLRVPEMRTEILAGIYEPAVYGDCADALFSMEWTDKKALALREHYLDGLRKEPLRTHLPKSLLKKPYSDELAPVLRAYDEAKLPRRDAIYAALCEQGTPVTDEAKAACKAPASREPQWVEEKLLRGDLTGGLIHLPVLKAERLAELVPVLLKFEAEERRGRDRVYRELCHYRAAQPQDLKTACETLRPDMEPRWMAREKAKQVNDEVAAYYRGGRQIGGVLLLLSLLIFSHSMLFGRRRSSTQEGSVPLV